MKPYLNVCGTRHPPDRYWFNKRGHSLQLLREAALVLVLLLPFSRTLYAQFGDNFDRLAHDVWTTQDGLPLPSIFNIIQTRDGYLWMSSTDYLGPPAITRFDGVQFKSFTLPNTFLTDSIAELYEDRTGTLLAGTANGLLVYDGSTFTLLDADTDPPQGYITTMGEDVTGTLWVSTREGRLFRRTAGTFEPVVIQHVPTDAPLWVIPDRQAGLWLYTAEVLLRVRNDSSFVVSTRADTIETLPWGAPQLAAHPDGGIWMASPNTRLSQDPPGNRLFPSAIGHYRAGDAGLRTMFYLETTQEIGPEDYIWKLLPMNDGSLWVGTTGGGLFRVQDEQIVRVPQRFNEQNIPALRMDREGSLWVGTEAGGLHRLRSLPFETITSAGGLHRNQVQLVYADRSGTLWIGFLGGYFQSLRADAFGYEISDPLTWFSNTFLRDMIQDEAGDLWIAGGEIGLVQHKIETMETISYDTGLPAEIYSILNDEHGTIWVGTEMGLSHLEQGRFQTLTTADGLAGDVVRVLFEDREEQIWVGTDRGLCLLVDDRPVCPALEGLPAMHVTSMVEDDEGALWVGSIDGSLVRILNDEVVRYTADDGLPMHQIQSLLDDGQGYLWTQSDIGINRIDKAALTADEASTSGRVPVVTYGSSDGLAISTSFWSGAMSTMTPDGKLWFATTEGLSVIDPSGNPLNDLPPPVYVQEVVVDGQAIPNTDTIVLPPGTGRLTLNYAGVSLLRPEGVGYKYRLVGFEDDWTEAGPARSVSFTSLPPGEYRFEVMAHNNDGLWSLEPATLTIIQRPFFYETTWFMILVGLGLLAVGFAIYRWRLAQIRRRNQQLEVEVAERTAELNQSLKDLTATQAQLVQQEKLASLGELTAGIAHEIKNPLNFVNNFAEMVGELAGELDDEIGSTQDASGSENTHHFKEILADLRLNAEQIAKHGRRADGIVSAMMQHASGGTGQREPTDVNALLEEYVNLAYHGKRAQVEGFNCEIKRDYDETVGEVMMVPQDIGRVFLNLLSNAFDAVSLQKPQGESNEEPVIRVSTRRREDAVEIRVQDNGPGIPINLLTKIYEPFYTTKPTGSGTGLGLSLSHDIVTQGHGGTLTVESEEGKGATFVVTLPSRLNVL